MRRCQQTCKHIARQLYVRWLGQLTKTHSQKSPHEFQGNSSVSLPRPHPCACRRGELICPLLRRAGGRPLSTRILADATVPMPNQTEPRIHPWAMPPWLHTRLRTPLALSPTTPPGKDSGNGGRQQSPQPVPPAASKLSCTPFSPPFVALLLLPPLPSRSLSPFSFSFFEYSHPICRPLAFVGLLSSVQKCKSRCLSRWPFATWSGAVVRLPLRPLLVTLLVAVEMELPGFSSSRFTGHQYPRRRKRALSVYQRRRVMDGCVLYRFICLYTSCCE